MLLVLVLVLIPPKNIRRTHMENFVCVLTPRYRYVFRWLFTPQNEPFPVISSLPCPFPISPFPFPHLRFPFLVLLSLPFLSFSFHSLPFLPLLPTCCLDATVLVHASCGELCKTAEPIKMPFVPWTRMDPRKHVLHEVHIGAT